MNNRDEQIRIRLHGIDAPEKTQDFYRVSKDFLAGLVMHKTVRVHRLKNDRYGRVVGVVYVDDIAVNEAILEAGLAWHYTEYDKNPEWRQLESSARRKRIGIWSQSNAVPPWQFRQQKRKQNQK